MGHIIAGLKGRDGRVLIPGFYDDVRPPDSDEVKLWVPIQEEDVLRQTGAPALEGEPEFSLAERRQSRPTLDVHGVRGGFTGEGTKTVIPAAAVAKVSMRTEVDRAVFRGPEERLVLLRRALDDLTAAGRITGEVVFEPSGDADISVEVTLAEREEPSRSEAR